jgi:peptidoglycan/LPS O-acetylase OafA/YrhL
MRGLAAVLVLLEHWRNALFIDYPDLPSHKQWFALPYLITVAGHQAVIIFFMLSGYLVSGSVFRMLERGTWSWLRYLVHRLMRLWVVLLPGLILCALWDRTGLHFHLAPALYGGALYNHMTPAVAPTLNFKVFLENLFFLQGIAAPDFGSDGALWSLANEFWYYMLFPLGLLAVYHSATSRVAPLARVVYVILFLSIALLLPRPLLNGFAIWLAGMALCFVPRLRIGNTARLVCGIAYVLIFLALIKFKALPGFVVDDILAFFTFLMLWVVVSATQPVRRSLGVRLSHELARFSYTLYVVHTPFLILLTALAVGDGRWVPSAGHIVEALCILAVVLAYAYGIASLTEFHTDGWRRRLEAALGFDASKGKAPVVSRT